MKISNSDKKLKQFFLPAALSPYQLPINSDFTVQCGDPIMAWNWQGNPSKAWKCLHLYQPED